MLGLMGILKSFTDELRKVQAEREAQLLLEVLRRRLGDLTFGDLAALLTSPLGKSLAAVKVSEAFAAAPVSAAAPVVTTPEAEETRASPGNARITVDLERQVVVSPTGREISFAVDPLRRTSLLEGKDDIAMALQHADAIAAWQSKDSAARPWVWMQGV